MPDYNPLRKLARNVLFDAFDFAMKVQDSPKERYKFYAIGNSHLDAAWRWRVMQTMSKAKTTFKNALKNMANYEEYTFSQSTPQFYEWMKDRHPRIFRAIQDQVRGKHWEIVGGMWIEPDCNLPDGESLVRQRLYGQRFYLNHFGRIAEIAWLPDTFGFCWTLPQILAKSGAKYFWTTKMLWNDTTRFPFSTFKWRGPDGSEVLTNITPLMGLSFLNMRNFKKTHRLVSYRKELVADSKSRPGDIKNSLSRDFIPEIGVFYGIGDGGGGPTEIEIEAALALKEKGVLEISTAGDFFRKLDKYSERLPVWNDEMYLEYHRGCYTTQGRTKSFNRQAETALRNAEIVHSMNSLFSNPYPGELLREYWKTALFNQFHDILPGSSIPEVYEDSALEYESLLASLRELIKKGMDSIAKRIYTENEALKKTTPFIAFNTMSWNRTSTAFLRLKDEDAKNLSVFDLNGDEVPSQVVDLDGAPSLAFHAANVPDLGYRTYYLKEKAPAKNELPDLITEQEDNTFTFENELFSAVMDGETGWITSMILKENGRELIAEPSNRFRLYKDDSKAFPAWNIDKNYRKKELEVSPLKEPPRIIDNGPVCANLEYTQHLGDGSSARVRVTIFRNRPLLMFSMNLGWFDAQRLLKMEFNTAIDSDIVTCDIPYGAIDRSSKPRYPAQKAQWEMPCQKWIDMSDGETGLSILNQDKYGFSAYGSSIALTLVRSPKYPKPIRQAWGLRPAEERPEYTDLEEHSIRYALSPHSGDWCDARLWQIAREFSDPMVVVRTDHHRGLIPPEATALSCSSNSTYVGAIKRPEDNPDKPDTKYHQIVVRLIEAAGRHDTVKLSFGTRMTITDVKETDLIEFSTKPIPGSENARAGEVDIEMKPYEIKTVKATLIESSKASGEGNK